MRIRTVGNSHDLVAVVVKNDETTLTILKGGPVFIKPDGTARRAVVSAETLVAARSGFFQGFALDNILAGADGEAQGYGLFDYCRVLLTSRAASTDVWASYSAGAIGDIMSAVTTALVQGMQRSAAGSATVQGWDVQLGETYASQTTQASSLGIAGSSFWTTTLRVLIRRM